MLDDGGMAERVAAVQTRIAAACARAGRDAAGVTLLAVSKNHPPARVAKAAELGLRIFGENRIQEARVKIPQCPSRLTWHFIGHLQSNKCREAAQWFQMVQGVDRLGIAQELDRWAQKLAKTVPILLEVNVAGESSKFGWNPELLMTELDAVNRLNRLEVHGLMTVAPYAVDPERVRPYFRRLRELKERCEAQMGVPLPVLSMGMSGDLEVAIEEGATLVRVGTAIFGERPRRGGGGEEGEGVGESE